MKHLLAFGILAFLLPGAALKAQRVQEEVLSVPTVTYCSGFPEKSTYCRVPEMRMAAMPASMAAYNVRIMLSFRNLNKVAATYAGVVSVNGERPNIRGARAEGTVYYIDGVRMLEMEVLPQKAMAFAALK